MLDHQLIPHILDYSIRSAHRQSCRCGGRFAIDIPSPGRALAPLEPLLALVEHHGEDDDDALDEDLPEGGHAKDDQAIGEEADDDGAASPEGGDLQAPAQSTVRRAAATWNVLRVHPIASDFLASRRPGVLDA